REQPEAERLPPVLPFVLHHGARPWQAPRDLRGLLDIDGCSRGIRDLQPQVRFVLDDLAAGGAAGSNRRALAAATLLPLLHLQMLRREADTAALLRRWRG